MTICDNMVASIHYTLKNDANEVIDSSRDREPLPYLHGAHNIVPGLEVELNGKCVGDTLETVIEAAQGYGEYDADLKQDVPKSSFQDSDALQPGMRFRAETQHGDMPVVITEVNEETVTVDGNHELAGERLHFSIEVMDVRAATKEELEHGHVHGAGGGH